MGIQLEMLEAEALKLTTGERAAFAPLLLASLDEDAEIERLGRLKSSAESQKSKVARYRLSQSPRLFFKFVAR